MLFLIISGKAGAQNAMSDPLPQDQHVVVGKLPNGVTYYLRHNQEPKERASFYIIRNAGALMETDEQDGLAHFLEHMAFNGTKNFPGNSLVKTLERHGVAFGSNLNAYTSTDETVYNISDVPVKDPAVIDTCLLILHDWSYYLTLDPKDIDEERGVIMEEWRTLQGGDERIRKQFMPVLLKDSKYAVRDVIGDPDVINNFKYEELSQFYHKWYRTDLQAIAIVGDFDLEEMEQKVKNLFAAIPAIENPQPRPESVVPYHEEIRYCLATDKEVQQTTVFLYSLMPKPSLAERRSHVSIRKSLISGLFSSMINSRLKETMQRGTAPYMGADISKGNMLTNYDSYTISATAMKEREEEAFEAILTENERVLRYGFTESELQRAKTIVSLSLEMMYKEKDKTHNDTYIEEMQSHFLTGAPLVDIEYYYPYAKSVLEEITADQVLAEVKSWNRQDNRTIVVIAQEDNGKHLTQEQVLSLEQKVRNTHIEPYDDSAISKALIEEVLKGSPVVKTKQLPLFGAVQWTLANGAIVVFRKAEYDKDEVSVTAFSQGGLSLYDRDMIPSAKMASYAPSLYGLGNYDAATLEKILAGKAVQSLVSIGGSDESVSGSSTPEDFETLMQLMYLQFEKPRFDPKIHQVQMEREYAAIANIDVNPAKVMRDSVTRIMNNYHERVWLMNEAYLNTITLDKIEQVYRERFSNAADFTYIIVGNIEEEFAREMAEKYIGSISSKRGRKETWKDNGVRAPKGKTEKVIPVDFQTPKANILVDFTAPLKYSPANSIKNSILGDILNLRYSASIREREGGSYGVGVSASNNLEPISTYTLAVTFDCDPKRADYLKSLVYTELKELATTPPTGQELKNVIRNMLKNNQQSKYKNSYWAGILYTYYKMGVNINDPKNYEQIIREMKPEDIRTYVQRFMKKADIVDITFVPQN